MISCQKCQWCRVSRQSMEGGKLKLRAPKPNGRTNSQSSKQMQECSPELTSEIDYFLHKSTIYISIVLCHYRLKQTASRSTRKHNVPGKGLGACKSTDGLYACSFREPLIGTQLTRQFWQMNRLMRTAARGALVPQSRRSSSNSGTSKPLPTPR